MPDPITPDPTADPKEQQVDNVVAAASAVAANWIHSPKAVGALAVATGLSPLAIHIGFMFASLFHHHYQQTGASTDVPAPAVPVQQPGK